MDNKTADLHIHSHYSDGTMTPEEILETALQGNIGMLAITDHNILKGSGILKELCRNKDIKYIPAVELDSLDNDTNIHILGYGVDICDMEFRDFTAKTRLQLDNISVRLIEKMQETISSVSLDEYSRYCYDPRGGGWKALHYFISKGLACSLHEGLSLYSKYNITSSGSGFQPVAHVCRNIHKAGGKAVLAHPGASIDTTDITNFSHELSRYISYGLDGIECYYPIHTQKVTEACLKICKEMGLLITTGSDCHGSFGDTRIGEMNIPVGLLYLGDLIK